MGKVVAFPNRLPVPYRGDPNLGAVCCWPLDGGGFEIGHESSSGNSWGSFERFDSANEAVAAAWRLARDTYGGCDLHVAPEVLAVWRPAKAVF
jgi:hypothetical protein